MPANSTKYNQEWYRKNRAKVRGRQRAYYLAHKEELTAKATDYSATHPESHRRASVRWRKAHPEQSRAIQNAAWIRTKRLYPHKVKAREQLKNAVRDGKITRAPCGVCKEPKTDGHHPDYSQPLNVIWLCRKHHAQLHHQAV